MTEVLRKVEKQVREQLDSDLPYHNMDHVEEYIENLSWLCNEMEVAPEKRKWMKLAGWLHDLGVTEGYQGHVARSIEMAEEILSNLGVREEKIEEVKDLIAATDPSETPENLSQQIMQDADSISAYAGGMETQRKIFKEFRSEGMVDSWEEQVKRSIEFISKAEFHTRPAQREYGGQKQQVLNRLREVESELHH